MEMLSTVIRYVYIYYVQVINTEDNNQESVA